METLSLQEKHEKTMTVINSVYSLLQRFEENIVRQSLITYCNFTADEADTAIKLTKDFKGL